MTDPDEVKAAAERVMDMAADIEEKWATHWMLDAAKVCRAYLEALPTLTRLREGEPKRKGSP